MMEVPVFKILEKAFDSLQQGMPFVLATVVEGVERTPGRTGFKLIAYADGRFAGTVGGGLLERMVLEKCREIHQTGKSALLAFELTETAAGIGMACGGTARVFLEYFGPLRKAFIFGAGHLCRSLLPVINSLGFFTVVIDHRQDHANREKLPEAGEIQIRDFLEFAGEFEPRAEDAVFIFTHGHIYDYDILEIICRRQLKMKYLGMIGSREKVQEAVTRIRNQEFPGNLIDSLRAPIGLNIGKTTVQEIAVSICAEVLAVYNGVQEIKPWRELV